MLLTPDMKKKTIEPEPLTESEREELIRLFNAYLFYRHMTFIERIFNKMTMY